MRPNGFDQFTMMVRQQLNGAGIEPVRQPSPTDLRHWFETERISAEEAARRAYELTRR